MIYGNINNLEQYREDTKLYAALVALKNYVNGDRYDAHSVARFNLQECDTCMIEDVRLENHHKYIDIHYVIKGAERVLVNCEGDLERLTDFSEEKDCELFVLSGTEKQVDLHEGDFLAVYPGESHAAKVAIDNVVAPIKKVVVKL